MLHAIMSLINEFVLKCLAYYAYKKFESPYVRGNALALATLTIIDTY